MIGAGKFNKRITIQELTAASPAQDSTGEPDESWAEVAEVWASIEPLMGREFTAMQQVQSEVTTRIVIRYRSGIDAKMRAVYQGRIFNIKNIIDPNEKHAELHLMCAEGVNNG